MWCEAGKVAKTRSEKMLCLQALHAQTHMRVHMHVYTLLLGDGHGGDIMR